jgi:putative inorganic carbon (HCO3(-)) transporter
MILTYLLTIIITTAWIIRMLFEKKFIFRRTYLDLPLVLFLAVQLLSLMLSIDPRTSWLGYYSRFNGGLVSFICYSLLYWAFVSNMDRTAAVKAVNTAIFAAGLISIYAVLEHFGIDAKLWVQDVQARVFSTLGQPNWLAAYLAALLPVSISRTLEAKTRFSKTAFAACSLLFLLSIIFTKSQSGIAVMLVTLFVYMFLMLLRQKKTKTIAISVAAFILLVIVNFRYVTTGFKSLSDLFTTQDLTAYTENVSKRIVGGTSSTLIRRIVWQGAFEIWKSSSKTFWLGTGPETFGMAYYQHRPIAHNYTSEWELLYNKAHNEFVNFLATTGVLGLGSYLLLLGAMLYILIRSATQKVILTETAILVGWLSIPITNFWGFSVVIIQILMFLFPAFIITLREIEPKNFKPVPAEPGWIQIWSSLAICGVSLFLGYTVLCYWTADVYYASSQKNLQTFAAAQNLSYLSDSYQNLTQSYELNPNDPPISAQLGLVAAYMAAYTNEAENTTASANFTHISEAASMRAILDSPYHPNYYKLRARTMIVLSIIDPKYMELADQTLADAMLISPTDPRLPYQRAVLSQRRGDLALTKKYLADALALKSDFADAIGLLHDISTPSASSR